MCFMFDVLVLDHGMISLLQQNYIRTCLIYSVVVKFSCMQALRGKGDSQTTQSSQQNLLGATLATGPALPQQINRWFHQAGVKKHMF